MSDNDPDDVYNYETSTTNLVINPSFETDQNDWSTFTQVGVTGSWLRIGSDGWVGTYAMRFTITGGTGGILAGGFITRIFKAAFVTVIPGEKYSASSAFRATTFDVAGRVGIAYYTSADVLIEEKSSLTYQPYSLDNPRRMRLNGYVAPSGAVKALIFADLVAQIDAPTGAGWFDGFQLENREQVSTYCDGDQDRCTWDGTPHASTSSRPRFRMDKLITSRSGVFEIYPRLELRTLHNDFIRDVSAKTVGGHVEMDYTRDIITVASFDLIDPDTIDAYSDYIAPFMKLVYADGREEDHQLGLFVAEPPTKSYSAHGVKVKYDCRDLTWILQERVTSTTYKLTQSTNRIAAVKAILATNGFTNYTMPPSSSTIGRGGKAWKPGTTYLQIINDLLTGAGYYHLFVSSTGWLTSHPYISRKNRKPVKKYVGGEEGVVLSTFDVSLVERPYNEVIVYREVKDGVIAKGIAVNDKASSPTSTVRIGRHTLFIQDSNVATSAEALTLAKEKLEEYGSLQIEATMTTLTEPWHGIHELYEIALDDEDGNVVDEISGYWWPTSWKIGFTPTEAKMVHKIKKFVDYADF